MRPDPTSCPHDETVDVTRYDRDEAEELCLSCGATIVVPRDSDLRER